jgi:SAM-dependent methyltransferase
MSLWGRIFAAGYDSFMGPPEKAVLRGHRKALLDRVKGRVLEIGDGTGANLPFYGGGIEELVITEPEEPMARRLERKLGDYPRRASCVHAQRSFPSRTSASTSSCLRSCCAQSTTRRARALREIHRLLKPNGQLLFVEHVRSDQPRLARWQDRLHGLQVRVGHGCHCNRRTLESIKGAGFSIAELEHDTLRKAPPIVRPLIVGAAERM